MLIIKDYGIELHQLTEDKIELVRNWRNSDKISRYMEFRDYITPEMQKRWFSKINETDNQFYFIIVADGKEVGLINIKNVDWNLRTGESGIFIYEDDCLHAGVAYRADICQRDFAFNVLHLSNLQAHIFNSNLRSINFHKKFGFELAEPEIIDASVEKNQLYILKRETYFTNRTKIINMLREKYNFTPPHWLNEYLIFRFLRYSSNAIAA